MSAQFRQNLNVTELDFEKIKENLASYLSTSDARFADWNFAGAGLNILLDALAYNTHYNAIAAHMAISEGFIDSAQLRESVVSLAKLIGYTPRSATAPRATINMSFTAASVNAPDDFVLPRGSTFSSTINSLTYVFVTTDDHTFIKDVNNRYIVNNIEIRAGFYQTKRYQIDNIRNSPTVSYEIDELNIDLSTLIVKVFSSATSTIPEIYTRLEDDISGIDETSSVFFVTENTNSNYSISFGNNIFGKKPANRAVIETEFLVTSGSRVNECSKFVYTGSIESGVNAAPIVTTVTSAFGGSDKESIESVRYNAPLSFITQNRAVTADDYRNLIFAKFPYVSTVSVWGGEDNDPPMYGRVYVSAKPAGNDVLSSTQRTEILTYLRKKKVLSIMPELVDPDYVKLTLDVFFKYNSNLIALNRGEIETDIREVVRGYNDDRLQSFDGVFRYSTLSSLIDSYHPAILNSHVRVFATKSFTLDPASIEKKTINFGTMLTPDDGHVIVSSSMFRVGGRDLFFADAEIEGGGDNRRIYTYYSKGSSKVVQDANIGTLNMRTGILTINEIAPDAVYTVTLDVMPISNDIVPRRNQLLQIDMNRLFIRGEIDTIAVGGMSRAVDYVPFTRDR